MQGFACSNGCWKHHQYRHCTTLDNQHHGCQEPWYIKEEWKALHHGYAICVTSFAKEVELVLLTPNKRNTKTPQELKVVGGGNEVVHGIQDLYPWHPFEINVQHGRNLCLVDANGVGKHLQHQEH